MEWKAHLDRMTADTVRSAVVALDYLDSDQLRHLEDLLDDEERGIKNWQKRGVYPIYNNITKKVVTRSSKLYSSQPIRRVVVGNEVDQDATDVYTGLLADSNFLSDSKHMDEVARLLKVCLVLFEYVEFEGGDFIKSTILHRGNCDIEYNNITRQIESLIYLSPFAGPSGGKLYYHWDASKVRQIESDGTNGKVIRSDDNPYGRLPIAVLWDTGKPRAGFWPKPAWEELTELNAVVNLYHTEVKFAERMNNMPPLFSNVEIPDGQTIGPDAVVQIKSNQGQDVFLEYLSPSINLDVYQEWIVSLSREVAENWSVNLKATNAGGGGTGSDSGFKLVVEEVWNLEGRVDRIQQGKKFEMQVYAAIKLLSDAHELGLPEGSVIQTDFPEPKLPVNSKEDWDILSSKVATKFIPQEEAWKIDNPDMSPEDIQARKDKLAEESAARRTLPTFTNDEG